MNNVLIFLLISSIILILAIICISIAPNINNVSYMNYNSSKDLDCEIFSDGEEMFKSKLDVFERLKTLKSLCIRQKSMYNIEYISLIINAILVFLCANFALINYFGGAQEYGKKLGIFGFVSGIIGFILTLIYVCFSGYIFTKDEAFGSIIFNNINPDNAPYLLSGIITLFPNGAKYKYNGNKYITAYEENVNYKSQYIKYKDLGDKQYNYNKDIYIKYMKNFPISSSTVNNCNILNSYHLINPNTKINNCDYLFSEPYKNNESRYLYNRWLATLILSVFIFIFDLILSTFGFLIFLDKKPSEELKNDPVVFDAK